MSTLVTPVIRWRRLSDVSAPVLSLISSHLSLTDQCALALTCRAHLSALRGGCSLLDMVSALTQCASLAAVCTALRVIVRPSAVRTLRIDPSHIYFTSTLLRRLVLDRCAAVTTLQVEVCRTGFSHACSPQHMESGRYGVGNSTTNVRWFVRAIDASCFDAVRTLYSPRLSIRSFRFSRLMRVSDATVMFSRTAAVSISARLDSLTVCNSLFTADNNPFHTELYVDHFVRVTAITLNRCVFGHWALNGLLNCVADQCGRVTELTVHHCLFASRPRVPAVTPSATTTTTATHPLTSLSIVAASMSARELATIARCFPRLDSLSLALCSVPSSVEVWATSV